MKLKKLLINQWNVMYISIAIGLISGGVYYFTTILPYVQDIGMWDTAIFFDAYTLAFIVWFMTILVIHALTDPDKYASYFDVPKRIK